MFHGVRSAAQLGFSVYTSSSSPWSPVPCSSLNVCPRIQGGLAHTEQEVVVRVARHALQLYEAGGPGVMQHNQTQRFLNPSYKPRRSTTATAIDPSDPPLRPFVETLARGEKLVGDTEPFFKWLAAFRCVRTVEQSVEGVHSVLTNTIRRAPAATLSYLSFEVRFRHLLDFAIEHPQVTPPQKHDFLRRPLIQL